MVTSALLHRATRDGDAVVLTPVGGPWNLSGEASILIDVVNHAAHGVALGAHVPPHRWTDGMVVVPPKSGATIWVLLKQFDIPKTLTERFPAMNGLPGDVVWIWDAPDPAKVAGLKVYALPGSPAGAFDVTGVRTWRRAADEAEPDPRSDAILPLLDEFGQYRHRDWPGKTKGEADLARARTEEDADLAAHPGPAEWNRWGGWEAGPTLKATGRFRAEKHGARWWLVDPDGRLFWSHGITCVNRSERTKVAGRERLFPGWTGESSDVYAMNLEKKFGAGWQETAAARAHVRLRSWGMNTIANWSEAPIRLMDKTPYCVAVNYGGPKKNGFPEVRDPGFRLALRESLALHAAESARDPWCLGWFIDNELHWPDRVDLAELAETYYRTCREELKAVAPDVLYLGSRIHMHYWPPEGQEAVIRAAAKSCDVFSFNRYRFSAADLALPPDLDMPLMVTEFHFGALDRGLLHTGLRSVGTQRQRAAAYEFYLRTCLENPAVVGAHWFQYHDQAVTGRFDGENYQIGFLDICDTPYPEIISASREVGSDLYQSRLR